MEGGTELSEYNVLKYRGDIVHSSLDFFLSLSCLLGSPFPREYLLSPLPSNKSLQQESQSQTLLQTQLLIFLLHKLKFREVKYVFAKSHSYVGT